MAKSEPPELLTFLRTIIDSLEDLSQVRIPRKEVVVRLGRMSKAQDPRSLFEDWEKQLRKPVILGNWSAFYSVYSDDLVLEHLPDWGQIERAIDVRRNNLNAELSDTVRSLSATEFCTFLANLFSRVSWASSIRVTKQSRDGGIDFEGTYVFHDGGKNSLFGQAKHWKGKVGGDQIRTFIGSVMGKARGRACIGLYVCTGGFTPDAIRELENSPFKIYHYELEGLVRLMTESNVGVRTIRLESPRIDGSFWDEIAL